MSSSQIAILAYADRRSLRTGERIAFKVSCTGGSRYHASIVKLASPQVFPIPDHPAFRPEPTGSAVDGSYPAREQRIAAGSYALCAAEAAFSELDSFTLCAFQ